MKPAFHLAICAPNEHSSSETFIANHVEHLPFRNFFLTGGWLPTDIPGYSPSSYFVLLNLLRRILARFRLADRIDFKNRLKGFLKKNGINAVLAEYGPSGCALMPICSELGLPLIVHFHGFDAYHNKTLEKYRIQYKELFSYAKAIIAVSNDMKGMLVSLGAPAEKVHLIHYGVDLKLFSPLGGSTKVGQEKTFLYVGRFVTKKTPQLVLIAFARVLRIFPNCRLVMIGDSGLGNSDELLVSCKQIAKALKIETAVQFTGALTPKEISNHMRSSLALIQHSVRSEGGDSEGSPNTILEAGASGIPVIGTYHGGIPDIVMNNESGLLVNEFDLEGLVEAMTYLVQNPNRADEMGRFARQHIEVNFSLHKQISKLASIISA